MDKIVSQNSFLDLRVLYATEPLIFEREELLLGLDWIRQR